MHSQALSQSGRPVRVLLVEDDAGDAVFTKKVLSALATPTQVDVVDQGDKVMPYLMRQDAFQDAQIPDIILMDITIPRKDGIAVVREIKADKLFRAIPILMFTSSSAISDVHHAYLAYANAYIVKPMDLNHFTGIMKAVEQFWFKVNVSMKLG